ncbi:MAG: IS200/IS605 family accessory protein TnpB-related protein, partial [Cyanobacteria bacterium P01_A01_bin.83]
MKLKAEMVVDFAIAQHLNHQLMSRNGSQDLQGKSSCKSPRSRGTLSILWLQPITIVEQDTATSR